MSRARLFVLSVAAALAAVVLVPAPAEAATATLSGVIRHANGDPAPRLAVTMFVDNGDDVEHAVTDAGGAFAMTANQGSVVALQFNASDAYGQFVVRSAYVQLSADRTEVVTLPAPSLVTTTVTEGDDGAPSVDAIVGAAPAGVLLNSSGGLDLTAVGYPHCGTDAAGSCTLRGFRGGFVEKFWVAGSGRVAEVFDGIPTPDVTATHSVVLAPAPTISGVLRGPGGVVIAGAKVTVVGAPIDSTTTGADGSWLMRTAAGGPYRVLVEGHVTSGGRVLPFEFETSEFQHTGPRAVELALPAIDQVGVTVRSSNGHSIAGAGVGTVGAVSVRTDRTADGLPVTIYLHRDGGASAASCVTNTTGRCELPVLTGGSSADLRVTAPGAPQAQAFPGSPFVSGEPREVTARLIGYAEAPSAGSGPGNVLATSAADLPVLDTYAVELPAGLDPVVGRIDYRATLPPGASSATIELALLGSGATALFRQRPDGDVDLVTVHTNGGYPTDEQTLTVTDGSADDTDGTVDGSVSGNIIPVVMAPTEIETTDLPAAAEGKAYSARLDASGPGGPFIWSTSPAAPLPQGLTLSSDGVVSGTAPQRGDHQFAVWVRDSRGWNEPVGRYVTLRVDKYAVITSSLPDAYVGGSYSAKLEGGGGLLTSWSVTSGSLPPGLALSKSGTISGRPTVAGTFGFELAVRASGTTSQPRYLTLTVDPMEIGTASLPDGSVGRWYSQALTTHGGRGPLTWSLVAGNLPPRLKLGAGGRITGTPSTRGTWTFEVRVTDSSVPKQEAIRTLSLTIG